MRGLKGGAGRIHWRDVSVAPSHPLRRRGPSEALQGSVPLPDVAPPWFSSLSLAMMGEGVPLRRYGTTGRGMISATGTCATSGGPGGVG